MALAGVLTEGRTASSGRTWPVEERLVAGLRLWCLLQGSCCWMLGTGSLPEMDGVNEAAADHPAGQITGKCEVGFGKGNTAGRDTQQLHRWLGRNTSGETGTRWWCEKRWKATQVTVEKGKLMI